MNVFTNFIFKYGLLAIFIIITIEYACFPISSEIVLPISGAVASISDISFLTLVIVSVIAGLIGTSTCYLIGKTGGKAIIGRITSKYPKSNKGINSSIDKFNNYGKYAVSRQINPLIRTYIDSLQEPLAYLTLIYFTISNWNYTVEHPVNWVSYYLREKLYIVSQYYIKYKEIILPLFYY